MFNPSTTDSRWSRSCDTKNLIIASIEETDAGHYRCSIITPITDSYTTTLTVTNPTAGIDGTCSNTAPIIECSTENAECSATNKCECKTGYEPNSAGTECSTTSFTDDLIHVD
ncbi:uncharacterized protein LOC128234660 [Mya arenaria]|uniref:uncharacterized protein LOC128234660 n=1 Tax=Mya arenaria TaxID=6604 RepID=UPI0022E8D5CC|nr:uncharacterized protein LOC128234660 [Mya arenaria]